MTTPDARPRAAALAAAAAACLALASMVPAAGPARPADPAAWGSDHVGKGFPDYVTGDECLFCHREVGQTWGENPHQLTVRPADPDDPALAALRRSPGGETFAGETSFLLGSVRETRFLKRSPDFGRLEVLSARHGPGGLSDAEGPRWDDRLFGDRCAGCHATAVDPEARAFSATSLDCFACHGDVDLGHTDDTRLVFLSKANREPRRVASACGQCHLRGGTSRSTGLPYPNTFVAGDNLFRDFRVDLSDAAIAALPAAQQHIWVNARDTAARDDRGTTCLDCHDVHKTSADRHTRLPSAALCDTCHVPGGDRGRLRDELSPARRSAVHNKTCDY